MKRLLVAVAAVGAVGVFGAERASAQICDYGGFGGGYGSGFGGAYASPGLSIHFGSSRGYTGFGHGGYGNGFGRGHAHRTWHDTSHYDYHPPSLVPHRNHYHYIPGHYHWHQTGHWDTHHHH